MLKQIEGSQGVAQAVALCRPDVVCAYPISPQTHIVENLGLLCRKGVLQDCEYINVESEFAAMSVAIGASVAGGRAYTAIASQGLLYMAEAVYNASGLGLPVVMTVANRAIGAPINIWNDHSDSMSQRDCGWIQLFAESIPVRHEYTLAPLSEVEGEWWSDKLDDSVTVQWIVDRDNRQIAAVREIYDGKTREAVLCITLDYGKVFRPLANIIERNSGGLVVDNRQNIVYHGENLAASDISFRTERNRKNAGPSAGRIYLCQQQRP